MGNKNKENTLTLSSDEVLETVDEAVAPEAELEEGSSAPRERKSKGGLWIGSLFLFLSISVALSFGGYWGWEQFSLFKQSTLQLVDDNRQRLQAQKQQVANLAPQLDSARRDQKVMAQSMQQSSQKLSQEQKQLKESVQALYNEMNKGRHHGWVIAESQYLINIANHRLYLSQDAEGAVAALKAADQRLRAVGDPSLLMARSAIADEISRLQSVPKIDMAGYSAKLISLQARVADLMLHSPTASIDAQQVSQEKPQENVDASGWREITEKVKVSLNDLIKVRRKEGKGIPFIPPEQSHYLRQNMKLKLEVARLALLQKDQKLFQSSLRSVSQWVSQYFQEDAVRNAMTSQLQSLSLLNLNIAYPNISGSRKALQSWVSMQNKALETSFITNNAGATE